MRKDFTVDASIMIEAVGFATMKINCQIQQLQKQMKNKQLNLTFGYIIHDSCYARKTNIEANI